MNLADTVRHNIKRLLEARGWTYGDTGFPPHYVSHVLTGKYGLSTQRIDDFAAVLGVSASDLCAAVQGERQ